jgi:hypothetical protein
MTTPQERTRALIETQRFLEELCAAGVPDQIRRSAKWCLRHYPQRDVIDVLARHSPDWLVSPQTLLPPGQSPGELLVEASVFMVQRAERLRRLAQNTEPD